MAMSKEGSFALGAGVMFLALKVLNRKTQTPQVKVEQKEPAQIPADLERAAEEESHEARPVAKAPRRAVRA